LSAASKRIRTATLDVAYEESGAADGVPVFLMHGWPYDPRCYDAVIAPLCAAGARVILPYLRGFGPTRFISDKTPRSGQQAALGNDLRELMDALAVDRAVLAGYDWGGRAACIVAALWPQRVRGLVTVNAYNIQNIPNSGIPAPPAQENVSGINIISRPSAAGRDSTPIGASCAGCFGNCGRRIGRSMTPPLNAALSRSTMPISST
jgi:pimeloyl-ACP methyl ester carboxylesterase